MIREGTLSMANVKHYTKVGNGQCVLKIVNAQAGPKRRLQDIRKKKKKKKEFPWWLSANKPNQYP